MADKGIDLEKAKLILQKGGLVGIPTETVYGLAANALDANAVAKIFTAKNRPDFNPLIVHVPDLETAAIYADKMPYAAYRLASLFWPGPLTLVVKKNPIIPDLVTSGLDTVGLRCPDHSLSRQLLQELPFPLAAPSANPFGYVSPTRAEHVNEQLGDRLEYILDGGPCSVGIESTIIGFENNAAVIYRLGGLSQEKIESVIGKVSLSVRSENPKAPGQLLSHYAPKKKVVIGHLPDLLLQYEGQRCGVLSFSHDYQFPHQVILSATGNIEEAAKNLFTALRKLDQLPIDVVLTEFVPEKGIGRAINDRLQRASVTPA